MRQLLTLFFFIFILTASGQISSLPGTYTINDTLEFELKLQADKKFIVKEISQDGERTLRGNWTFQNDTIILKTTRVSGWEKKTNERRDFCTNDFPDTIISVDKERHLTVLPPKNATGEDKYMITKLKKIN
jgi:hypothetical protein